MARKLYDVVTILGDRWIISEGRVMAEPLETYLESYLEFVTDVTSPKGLAKVRAALYAALADHDAAVKAQVLADLTRGWNPIADGSFGKGE